MNYKIKKVNNELKVFNENIETIKDYILVNENEWKYLNNIKNEYQVIDIKDNKLKIIYDENISLDILKQNLIKIVNKNYQDYIYSKYPQHKQLNIIGRINGYTDEDFNVMNSFISDIIARYNIKKNKINDCENKNDLINIELKFEGI